MTSRTTHPLAFAQRLLDQGLLYQGLLHQGLLHQRAHFDLANIPRSWRASDSLMEDPNAQKHFGCAAAVV